MPRPRDIQSRPVAFGRSVDWVTGIALTVSLDPALSDQIRAASSQAGMTEACWLAFVASSQLFRGGPPVADPEGTRRRSAVEEWLDESDREHGPPTGEDLEWASRVLGLRDACKPC